MEELDLAELYESSKHRRSYKSASAAVVVAVLLSLAWLVFSFYKVATLNRESKLLNTELTETKKTIDRQKSESDKLEKELAEKRQLIQALAYLLDVSPETNSGTAATDYSKIRVQYFSRDIKPEAFLALQQFGFSLDDKRPQTDVPTSNLIFFGKNISPTDIRLVAFVLFKSSFKIDDIKPFPKSSGNEDVIQIGDLGKSSTSNIPWTLEKIAGIANTNVDLSFLSGAWEGVAYQASYGTWPIKLTVQNGRYFVDYPTINCKGEWKLTDKSITMVKFRERLTEGIDNCVNNGYVIIRRTDGDFTQKTRASQINFNYINPGGNVVTSWGVLNRTR